MKCLSLPPVTLLLGCLIFGAAAHAAITWQGDVYPADPSTWSSGMDARIGNTAGGTVTVDSPSRLNASSMYVGWHGDGTLNVTNDRSVVATSNLYVGYYSKGTVNVTMAAPFSAADLEVAQAADVP